MKRLLTSAMSAILALTLTSCSSGDEPNDLIEFPPWFTSEEVSIEDETTSTDSGVVLNPNLLNGRTKINTDSLVVQVLAEIKYNSFKQQQLYSVTDEELAIFCLVTLTIETEDIGPDSSYTDLIQAREREGVETVSITEIAGPTDNVGTEFIYSFETEQEANILSIGHMHYLSPQDVTFNKPALSTTDCATFADRYGQNEAQMRAILNSVEFLRGTDGEPS